METVQSNEELKVLSTRTIGLDLARRKYKIKNKTYRVKVKQFPDKILIHINGNTSKRKREKIHLTTAVLRNFMCALEEFVGIVRNNGQKLGNRNNSSKKFIIKENGYNHLLVLKKNQYGAYVHIMNKGVEGYTLSQIMVPINGLNEFRYMLSELLFDFGNIEYFIDGSLSDMEFHLLDERSLFWD